MHDDRVHHLAPDLRDQLQALRSGLLRLHKALLDAEQITYERIHGRVTSPGHLLQLVMKDPWFTWLHPLSKLVVQIDEMLEEDQEEEVSQDHDPRTILDRIQAILRPSESGDGFERSYYEALQRAPDVVLAHAHVKRLLATAYR